MARLAGKGTLLQIKIDTTWTTIGQRVSLSGPNRTVGTDDMTNLDSTRVEYRPTLLDNGDLSGTLQYDPADATHQVLEDLMDDPAERDWRLVLSNGYYYEITDGFLTAFNVTGMEATGHVTADFTIQNGDIERNEPEGD